jgi:hypothetical protein
MQKQVQAESERAWEIEVFDLSLDLRGSIGGAEYGQRRYRMRVMSWELRLSGEDFR